MVTFLQYISQIFTFLAISYACVCKRLGISRSQNQKKKIQLCKSNKNLKLKQFNMEKAIIYTLAIKTKHTNGTFISRISLVAKDKSVSTADYTNKLPRQQMPLDRHDRKTLLKVKFITTHSYIIFIWQTINIILVFLIPFCTFVLHDFYSLCGWVCAVISK